MSNVMNLDSMKSPKMKAVLRNIVDYFDNKRGNVEENLALTIFKDMNGPHEIVMNTLSPDLNGKQLVKVGASGLLLSRVKIANIVCSDPKNNDQITLLADPNNKITYEARSDTNKIRFFIKLDDPESDVAALSIGFANAVDRQYMFDIFLVNQNGDYVSEVHGVVPSQDTNTTQFFQLQNKAEGVDRILIDMEVLMNENFTWLLKSIQIYSHMDDKAMKLLSDAGTVVWQKIGNPLLTKKFNDPNAPKLVATAEEQQFLDPYGTPIPVTPDFDKAFYDQVQDPVRPYAITPIAVGQGDIKVYESNKDTQNLTFNFSPSQQINRYPDEAIVTMDKLVEKGAIKHGGFKNYCLTFYIKLDGINRVGQYLIWKYGGWLFNSEFPNMCRATDVYIPVGDSNEFPKVFEEYTYGKLIEQQEGVIFSSTEPISLEENKWIGIQFIREVINKNHCKVTMKVNRNPIENDRLKPNRFETFMVFEDVTREGHQANTWGGIVEVLSVTGARYINIYGLSLYEFNPINNTISVNGNNESNSNTG